MSTVTVFLLLKLLALAAGLGLGAKLTAWLLGKLPSSANVHTKSDLLNKLLDIVLDALIAAAKAILTHADLDALLSATASGAPISSVAAELLQTVISAALSTLPQFIQDALAKLLGGKDAASQKISQLATSAVADLVSAHKAAGAAPQPGQIAKLASGHLLVVPAGQALPAGATLAVKKAA